jgi:predicted nucleotidyltransferase
VEEEVHSGLDLVVEVREGAHGVEWMKVDQVLQNNTWTLDTNVDITLSTLWLLHTNTKLLKRENIHITFTINETFL